MTRPFLFRPWLVVPLAIYSVTRLVSGLFLLLGSARQGAITADGTIDYKVSGSTGDSPGYLGVITNWDGQWYQSIALHGYPPDLPTAGGEVLPNEWAFLPGYPSLVRIVMELSGTSFPLAATIVSLTCGAAAVTLLYDVVRRHLDHHAAATLVLALCCFPSAPVLQAAYAESLTLLLVVLSLRALTARRHGLLLLWCALLALTRPILLPMSLVCAAVWLLRWRNRQEHPFPGRERLGLGGVAATCLLMAGAWPVISGLATGRPSAFTDTIGAWRMNKGSGASVNWLSLAVTDPLSYGVVVFPVVALIVYSSLRAPMRALPAEWRLWAPLYMGYMLVATKPTIGLLRYVLIAMFPLAPLLEPAAPTDRRSARVSRWLAPGMLALVALVGQYLWVTHIFVVDPSRGSQLYP